MQKQKWYKPTVVLIKQKVRRSRMEMWSRDCSESLESEYLTRGNNDFRYPLLTWNRQWVMQVVVNDGRITLYFVKLQRSRHYEGGTSRSGKVTDRDAHKHCQYYEVRCWYDGKQRRWRRKERARETHHAHLYDLPDTVEHVFSNEKVILYDSCMKSEKCMFRAGTFIIWELTR